MLGTVTDHDADGHISASPAVPTAACGQHLVAVDVATCAVSPRATFGHTGTMLAADGRAIGGQLYRIDLDRGTVDAIGPLDHPVTSLAVAPDGTWWAAEASARAPGTALSTLDPDTAALTTVHVSDQFGWSGLAFDAEGRMLGWTEDGDSLVLVDPDAGEEAAIYGSISANHCLAADASGQLWRYYNGWLYAVDPIAGTEVWYGAPPGLAAGRDGVGCTFHHGRLYVTAMDPLDAERQLVAVDLDAWVATEVHVAMPPDADGLGSAEP